MDCELSLEAEEEEKEEGRIGTRFRGGDGGGYTKPPPRVMVCGKLNFETALAFSPHSWRSTTWLTVPFFPLLHPSPPSSTFVPNGGCFTKYYPSITHSLLLRLDLG
uniref:Uncharacterized protein n=1 Tax=Physcomitrium patens TaxID=3218 RepID=A0A2K1IFI9_PHYPA|nr:hypothetical protein PHYPA_028634 [Physcomitrium patens]